MRTSTTVGPMTVRAYAGSTGVLLAVDVADAARDGLLGFAIAERRGNRPFRWLPTKLGWAGEPPPADRQYFPSVTHPVQKFRWSDYTVEPGRTYHYRVHAARGDWARPDLDDPVEVTVDTHRRLAGGHQVIFNRAAAASQAFSRRFPEVEAELKAAQAAGQPYQLPAKALDWLSRGVAAAVVAFLDQAVDATWALDVAIYEYELDVVVDAVRAAVDRGAQVRIVYHAKEGDPQTVENEAHLAGIPASARRARRTSAIFHDKFLVASRVGPAGRRPVAVLAGSTNFTHNGVYRQANVVHVIRDEAAAATYADVFERLFAGATAAEMRAHLTQANPVVTDQELAVGFSPRSGKKDLAAFVDVVDRASRDVLFATAFDLYDPLEDALLGQAGDEVVRLGVTNQRNNRITGYHRDRSARFTATALLPRGIEGFLAESYAGQRGNIHIHTKLLVADFTTDAPTVISGSHNLSNNGSVANDENYLVSHGRTDLADCYGVELLRIYEHYRARFRLQGASPFRPTLTKGDAWTGKYWDQPLERLDRMRFAHGA